MYGLDALAARLTALMQRLTRAETELPEALAARALAEAQTRVPVDTGRLRASLRADGACVTTDCPYAAYVEMGTSRAAAQPYLQPALHAVRAEAAAMAAEEIGEG